MKLSFPTFDTTASQVMCFVLGFFFRCCFVQLMSQRPDRPCVGTAHRQTCRPECRQAGETAEISWTLRHAENVASILFFPLLPPQKSFSPHQQLCPTIDFTGLKPTDIVHSGLDLSTSITIKAHLQNEYYDFPFVPDSSKVASCYQKTAYLALCLQPPEKMLGISLRLKLMLLST